MDPFQTSIYLHLQLNITCNYLVELVMFMHIENSVAWASSMDNLTLALKCMRNHFSIPKILPPYTLSINLYNYNKPWKITMSPQIAEFPITIGHLHVVIKEPLLQHL